MGDLFDLFQEKSILKVFKPNFEFSFYNSFTLCVNCAYHAAEPI